MKNWRLNFRNNQRGDTIIEVLIAITILSATLFSAYALANQTAKLGLSAREQDQSTQLLQHQAEGLRHMRDNAESWQDFTEAVDQYDEFHVRINGSADEWQVRNGRGNGEDILDDSFSLFTTWSEVVSSGSEDDRRDIVIHVEWETVNGQKQTSTTDIVLVNTDSLAPPPRLEPSVTCNNLHANPDSGTTPLHVNFSVNYDVEDTSVTNFRFNFGDGRGRTSNNNQTNHTYTSSGSYIAGVQINTEDGETDSCHASVDVAAKSRTFTYTGSLQHYKVPSGVNEIRVDAYGAQGGHTPGGSGGGRGGRTRTAISVTPGETLKIYVGGRGGRARNNAGASGGNGGYPNGGNGGNGGATTGSGAGGGGSSEVHRSHTRLVVAAGGGGPTRYSCSKGGDGGPVGEDGQSDGSGWGEAEGGGGATQSSGGAGGSGSGFTGDGGYGGWNIGGYGGSTSGGGGGGGGGGYYGGGGGGSAPYTCAGGGGGGSSFTSGYSTLFQTGVKNGHGRIEITPL